MPNKKDLAGSTESSSPKSHSHKEEDCAVAGNRVVAELIQRIEAMLSMDSLAPPTSEENQTEKRQRTLCHVSISYVRGHGASSIDIFWRESAERKDFRFSSRKEARDIMLSHVRQEVGSGGWLG
ncbi:hypothetical protein [Rhizorhapis suberifaciens]|uniref:Uncharacterized protein n=1 Tax=Rhizorhapis suberifaciens TaxID=13656 RepID=A0A840HTQ9_9SPHN|nr:hypothetical protein [Rhizorhapis suberifaciens]MBB4641081.1 hypothetical protein [Rhizorhapis suberifaciens]